MLSGISALGFCVCVRAFYSKNSGYQWIVGFPSFPYVRGAVAPGVMLLDFQAAYWPETVPGNKQNIHKSTPEILYLT